MGHEEARRRTTADPPPKKGANSVPKKESNADVSKTGKFMGTTYAPLKGHVYEIGTDQKPIFSSIRLTQVLIYHVGQKYTQSLAKKAIDRLRPNVFSPPVVVS